MIPDQDDRLLEEAIRCAVGSEIVHFEAAAWIRRHPEEIAILESRKSSSATGRNRLWSCWRQIMDTRAVKIAASAAVAASIAVIAIIWIAGGGSHQPVSPPAVTPVMPESPSNGNVAIKSPTTNKSPAQEKLQTTSLVERSLEQCVNDAGVIVVAVPLDSSPAEPNVKGDLPEVWIRWQVIRILKGKLADQIIAARSPTGLKEFVGKEWVIMLSPEFPEFPFAGCYSIKVEPEVRAILSKAPKAEPKQKTQAKTSL